MLVKMGKLDEAKDILNQVGMPKAQQNDLCAYTLLALLNIKENSEWDKANNEYIRIHDISPKRMVEIGEITRECGYGKIYITAFLDMKTFKKFAEDLAWETEVWLAEMPEHMIHLNGDKFMGPRA